MEIRLTESRMCVMSAVMWFFYVFSELTPSCWHFKASLLCTFYPIEITEISLNIKVGWENWKIRWLHVPGTLVKWCSNKIELIMELITYIQDKSTKRNQKEIEKNHSEIEDWGKVSLQESLRKRSSVKLQWCFHWL